MSTREPIAIVGMGCRFPGAEGVDALWRLLASGVDAIAPIPQHRLDIERLYDPKPRPGRLVTRFGGFLPQHDRFDALFFGVSPREAEQMDPQQRIAMEAAYWALEDAGQLVPTLAGSRTGVYMGSLYSDYEHLQARHPDSYDIHAYTGGARAGLPGRISHAFGLGGPAVSVDTACSSSLVAVHLACQGLRAGETTLALAGGVNVILLPAFSTCFSSAGMLAPDGRCKAFDARGDGFVRSEGVGVVALKRLSDALRDGDRVYAVIRGSALNHDGDESPYMMPSAEGQERLLREAYAAAGVDPKAVDYVEAHGTGTRVGDPVEVRALSKVLGENRDPAHPLAIGSIKTNIGHTEGAAGIAGVIKVALSLYHGELPRSLHFQVPNPNIPWSEIPIRVQTQHEVWPPGARKIAGVNSFGITGVNAHIVLESPAPHGASEQADEPVILPLSAHSEQALADRMASIVAFLAAPAPAHGELASAREIAFTTACRRDLTQRYRTAVVGRTREALAEALRTHMEDGKVQAPARLATEKRPKVVFVFPGQGSQWVGMGRKLYERYAAFRETIEAVDQAFAPHMKRSIRELLLEAPAESLRGIDIIQPLLLAVEIALAATWKSLGVIPDGVVGHSMGEIAAAHVAGVLSLEDAGAIICHRSRLMRGLSGNGAMVAVELSLADAERLLVGRESSVSVAVSNSATSTVLAGAPAAVEEIIKELEAREIFCRRINVDVASHSPQMEPLREALLEAIQGIRPQAPKVPFYSTVVPHEGRRKDDTLVLNAEYWWHNLRDPVRFAQATGHLLESDHTIFVEMSPHPILAAPLSATISAMGSPAVVVGSMRREDDEESTLLQNVASLFSAGYTVDFSKLYGEQGPLVSLPNYPFQRERYWKEPAATPAGRSGPARGILGQPVAIAAHPESKYWDGDLSVMSVPWLTDHRVQGSIVLPGAAFVEAAIAAASLGGQSVVVEQLALKDALFVPAEASVHLQVSADTLAKGVRVSFFSRDEAREGDASEPPTRKLAECIVRKGQARPGDQRDGAGTPPAARAERLDAVDVTAVYAAFRARGLEYGEAFRGITAAYRGSGEALAHIVLPSAAQVRGFEIAPPLLDAIFQVLVLALPPSSGPVVPVAAAKIELDLPLPERVWAHATVAGDRGHIEVCDDAGKVVGRVEGLEVRGIEGATPGKRDRVEDWFYERSFEARPVAADAATESLAPGTWVVLVDQGSSVGRTLASLLSARGHRCVLATPARRASDRFEKLSPGHYRMRADAEEDMSALLHAAMEGAHGPLHGVVNLWNLDSGLAASVKSDRLGCMPVLHAVRAVHRWVETNAVAEWPRLWVVSRGAQVVSGPSDMVAPSAAAAWGFGRALAQEHRELLGAFIDLDPTDSSDRPAARLCAELLQPDGELEIAFRRDQRYVARLERVALEPAASPLRLRGDATYLITGGLGGLGAALAERMVELGARRLILTGRSPMPPRDVWPHVFESDQKARIDLVRHLEALGASIHCWSLDVADESALREHVETYAKDGWPPIAGIVHCAGVLQDRTILQLEASDFDAVYRSKVVGSLNLHHVFASTPLEFFVLFSSAAALLGMPGQANYCAANAFLDGLAEYRRSQGLPAVSIQWGPWASVGLAAQDLRGGRLDRMGFRSFEPSPALDAMERIMGSSRTVVGVLKMDWALWHRESAVAQTLPLLERMRSAQAPDAQESCAPRALSIRAGVLAGNGAEREAKVREYLAALIGKVLRIPADRVDATKALKRMGLDSLMAVELKNRIEADFRVSIPVMRILSGAALTDLAGEIGKALKDCAEGSSAPKRASVPAATAPGAVHVLKIAANPPVSITEAESLLDRVDDMSEAEVEGLLRRMSRGAAE